LPQGNQEKDGRIPQLGPFHQRRPTFSTLEFVGEGCGVFHVKVHAPCGVSDSLELRPVCSRVRQLEVGTLYEKLGGLVGNSFTLSNQPCIDLIAASRGGVIRSHEDIGFHGAGARRQDCRFVTFVNDFHRNLSCVGLALRLPLSRHANGYGLSHFIVRLIRTDGQQGPLGIRVATGKPPNRLAPKPSEKGIGLAKNAGQAAPSPRRIHGKRHRVTGTISLDHDHGRRAIIANKIGIDCQNLGAWFSLLDKARA